MQAGLNKPLAVAITSPAIFSQDIWACYAFNSHKIPTVLLYFVSVWAVSSWCMCVIIYPYHLGLLFWHWQKNGNIFFKYVSKISWYLTTTKQNEDWTALTWFGICTLSTCRSNLHHHNHNIWNTILIRTCSSYLSLSEFSSSYTLWYLVVGRVEFKAFVACWQESG